MRAEEGAFDDLSSENKEFVMELVAGYDYRTGKIHPDGSMGVIKITSKQLNDLLAFAFSEGMYS